MNQIVEVLSSKHNRKNFDCGQKQLDNYIKRFVSQDAKRNLAVCYVLADEKDKVVGYYTLSSSSIPKILVPTKYLNKVGTYPTVPTILLGRLAVDSAQQGKGTGQYLLVDALRNCAKIADSLGAAGVIVDPIDKSAESFYGKYGFIKLPDSGKMMVAMSLVYDVANVFYTPHPGTK